MFSPSDYNDAVPQFTNGNYANTPLNPLYVEEPDAVNYNRGSEPLQTLPAQWWNWLLNKITSKLNKLNVYVKNIFDELTQLLSLVGITPDATEVEITTGQLKDMFQNGYPLFLENNFNFESVLQGRTRGVVVAPNDTWTNNTNALSLTGGFGIINSYKKVTFADCNLTLPNDNAVHYIVSDVDGTISIEDTLEDGVILVGLCHNKEYCLLIDNNPDQCKDSIILDKWYGQNKITQNFVSILQSYYNTSTASIKTKITINGVGDIGINGGTFTHCTIQINTVNGTYGIGSGTFNNCDIQINATYKGGIGGTFNNCTIQINTINDIGSLNVGINSGTFNNCSIMFGSVSGIVTTIGGGTFNSCAIKINTVSGSSAKGVGGGTFTHCTIVISSVSGSGIGINNISSVSLYLTRISCSTTTNLDNTGGKLNVLNNTVLHAS